MAGSLQDVVVALQAAARQAGVYPAGHPARGAAFQNAHARLAGFLAGSGGLTLAVAKEALLHGDKRIDTPAARALAKALFQREVAVLRIEEGIGPPSSGCCSSRSPSGRARAARRSTWSCRA
jgi:hypothetical protein